MPTQTPIEEDFEKSLQSFKTGDQKMAQTLDLITKTQGGNKKKAGMADAVEATEAIRKWVRYLLRSLTSNSGHPHQEQG